MGERLSTQLETLQRERERLEELLMLDANWRALRQLNQPKDGRDPLQAADGSDLRTSLTEALASNRIFAARAKLIETIELLSNFPADSDVSRVRPCGTFTGAERVSSRIVMLNLPGSGSFPARVRMKLAEDDNPRELRLEPVLQTEQAVEPPATSATFKSAKAALLPDALELIDGLGRHAVELLLSHEVRSFADIAGWTPVNAAVWRARLDGLAEGLPSAWIEQAALLAAGGETHFAARVRRGEFASLVPSPAPEPMRLAPAATPGVVAVELDPATMPPTVPAPTQSAVPNLLPSTRPLPVTQPAAQADAVDRLSPWSKPSQSRPVFSRPIEPMPEEVERSEVGVIARPDGDSHEGAPLTSSQGAHTNRLVRRLKELEGEERFSASDYAAYKGEVEEASVLIIAPDAKPARTQPSTPAAAGARSDRPSVQHFLRALTGRS